MNRNLSPTVMKGMYGHPREIKGGDYLRANIEKNSGGFLGQASTVNGSKDTVRQPVKRGKIKK